MNKKVCDNTDHTGEAVDIKEVVLLGDFDGEHCFWCRACRARDNEMIDARFIQIKQTNKEKNEG